MLRDCHLKILDSSLGLRFVTEVRWDNEHVQGTVPLPAASLGWNLYCPHPHLWSLNQPSLSASPSHDCHFLILAQAWEAHSVLTSGEGYGRPSLPLPVSITDIWQVIKDHNSVGTSLLPIPNPDT